MIGSSANDQSSHMIAKDSAITSTLGVDHKLNDMYNTIAETAKSLVEDLNKEEQKNMDLYATEN
jgi:tyrosine-protein phosphatase YwqE